MSVSSLFAAKTPVGRWLTVFGCGLYILSPIDLMPEVILGPFGLGDDAVAFAALIRQLVFPSAKEA